MATWLLTLSLNGTSTPDNTSTGGPVTDTISNAVTSSTQFALATGFAGVIAPSGATSMLLYVPAGNTNAISYSTNSSGTNAPSLGSGWTWNRLGCVGGTTYYFACASNTSPPELTVTFK